MKFIHCIGGAAFGFGVDGLFEGLADTQLAGAELQGAEEAWLDHAVGGETESVACGAVAPAASFHHAEAARFEIHFVDKTHLEFVRFAKLFHGKCIGFG